MERAQWLLCVPPGLTFTDSTFCPHSVFRCFVHISEQTAFTFLYSISRLDFITETECVTARFGLGLSIKFRLMRIIYFYKPYVAMNPPSILYSCVFA
jgi:hypothetical protein